MTEGQRNTIGVLGAGNMGRALILGLLKSRQFAGDQLMASDVDARQRDALAQATGIAVTDSNNALAGFAQTLVLAVKPQIIQSVLDELSGVLRPGQLVISIAAGIPLSRLEKALPNNPVVRVMPNTPALVGKGIAALCGGSKADAGHVEQASAILRCVGEVITVPEAWMDAVTATSGSGPAYVFYFIEALVAGAVELGIESKAAHKLVVETFAGSLALLQGSGDAPDVLRKRVTSPGGTTEAALRLLDEKGTRKVIADALLAAANRGRELSHG